MGNRVIKIEEWEVTGPVPVRGHNPGAKFNVEVYENGIPVDSYWRKAKKREQDNKGGYLKFPGLEPANKSKPETDQSSSLAKPETKPQKLSPQS